MERKLEGTFCSFRSVLVLLYTLLMIDTATMDCSLGFTGPTCKKQNVALNKSTAQISTLSWNGYIYTSHLVVDGNTNTDLDAGSSCSHTNTDTPSWWYVLLDKEYNITQMTVYLRNKEGNRYKNMQVLVGGSLCKNISISSIGNGPPSPNPVYVTDCYKPQRGNNVTIRVNNAYLTLCEVQIWVCSDGWFGENCTVPCNCMNNSDICDKVTGYCRGGCASGWQGDGCQTECDDKYFGNCSQRCNCQDTEEVCNKTTGACVSGCKLGTYETDCQTVCDDKYFGNCSQRCNCHNIEEVCNKTTGACVSGCKHGTYEPDCQTICSDGWFGENCTVPCNCMNDSEICDKVTGHCRGGCASGWQGDGCQTECDDKYFGNCSQRCNCQDTGEVCNKTTGVCVSGCKRGTYEPDCQTVCKDKTYGNNCSQSCGLCKDGLPCDPEGGECLGGCESGFMDGKCDTAQLTHSLGPVVGGVVAAVVVLVLVGIIILFFVRRRKAANKAQQAEHSYENSVTVNDLKVVDDPVPPTAAAGTDCQYETIAGDPYYKNIPANIPVDSLKKLIRDKIAQGGFEAEYKMIHYGPMAEHEVGKKPENKKRNRFIALFPYDHSRVKLTPDGNSTWDYINASFVSGYDDNTTFIAAQGPNLITVDDFWRMVWQQNVRKIVMLTRLMELNKKKCEQYWPESGEKKQCGNISIETTLSTVRADFTIRTLKVQHMNSVARTVTQFHFTTWPDHDVPAAPALVGFWKQVKLTDEQTDNNTGHPVIHCSAGVGRTGTFIALDSLVTQAETENKVNIFMCVARMRVDRMNMVQTKEQYQFVYEVLLEALESRGTFYTLSEFDRKYGSGLTYTRQQETELKKQFKSLQNLKVEHGEKLTSDALCPENVKKNRSEEILPTNRTRLFLTTPVSGHNDYINAVMLPSTTRDSYFIATQTPLSETVVDFWRLVYDHDCFTIVCLDNSLVADSKSLYPREKTSSTVGPFILETVSEDKSRDSYAHLNMTITHQDENDSKRRLDVYRVLSMDKTPGPTDIDAILEFMNVLFNNSISDDQKMLVQCLDGSRMCGVFCSMMNVVSRLRLDKEVDIFLTIRELQAIRPQFVPTYEQYKLCHDIVKEYIRSSNIYANA